MEMMYDFFGDNYVPVCPHSSFRRFARGFFLLIGGASLAGFLLLLGGASLVGFFLLLCGASREFPDS